MRRLSVPRKRVQFTGFYTTIVLPLLMFVLAAVLLDAHLSRGNHFTRAVPIQRVRAQRGGITSRALAHRGRRDGAQLAGSTGV